MNTLNFPFNANRKMRSRRECAPMKLLGTLTMITCILQLGACSTGADLMIDNQTSSPIEIIRRDGYTTRVESHSESREVFVVSCRDFEINHQRYSLDFPFPPRDYFEPGFFYSTLRLRITPEGEALIVSKQKPELPPIAVPMGCQASGGARPH